MRKKQIYVEEIDQQIKILVENNLAEIESSSFIL